MEKVFSIPISRDDLLRMKSAGNAEIHIEIKDEETGETSELTIALSPEQIDRMLLVMEAGDRAMRN
jgi:hypothetical protein